MNSVGGLILVLGIGVSIPAVTAQVSAGQEPNGATPGKDGSSSAGAEAQHRELDEFKRSAARYRILTDTERPKVLMLAPEPVLRWTNPVRGTVAGAVFVWLADGRPEVIMSVYRYPEDGKEVEENEFQSLATTGLTATRKGQEVWVPRTPGIRLDPIPGAPKPAATPAERLRQMRTLAREFHAFFDAPEDRTELRLLPKPLFRYETKRPDLADGALFAFVLTTDPEVLLLIEARSVGGASVWHYGFARMSMVNLRGAQGSQRLESRVGQRAPQSDASVRFDPWCRHSELKPRPPAAVLLPHHSLGNHLMLAPKFSRPVAITLALGLIASAGLVQLPPGYGQDAASKAKNEKGKWVPLFQHHAGEYRIRVGEDASGETRRLPEPLLRWWQPVRGGDDGALYLWEREGRPVAVVTFFTFKFADGTRCITHERHSLAAGPVEAAWRGDKVWHTSRPGLTFKPVPNATAPADTAPARLRQMQALVRDFSANTIDDKGSTWPLRPLAKPLYRSESKDDGAVFALVQGTDPEAFVVLEARGEGKDAHWNYAVARFTDLELRVRLKDHEVFSGPHTLGGATEIYQTLVVIRKPSDSPADFE